jgi:hypothetical protein
MAAIVSSPAVAGRISPYVFLSGILCTINGNGATYATATGGLPFDLAAFLSSALQNDAPYLNPGDVIALAIPSVSSTGKYLTAILALGTPTYTAAVGSGYGSAAGVPAPMSVQPDNTLTTFPCTIRLYNGTTEFADGACSETFTIMLLISRNGVNA